MRESDYEVGYGKPPKHTRFNKGNSGNPSGRPKGKRNLLTTLLETLYEKVTVTENGRRKQITKLEATFKQMVNKAAAGDIASAKLLIQMFPGLESLLDDKTGKKQSSEADMVLLQQLQKRFLADVNRNKPAADRGDES